MVLFGFEDIMERSRTFFAGAEMIITGVFAAKLNCICIGKGGGVRWNIKNEPRLEKVKTILRDDWQGYRK